MARILLAEDDPTMRRFLTRSLTQAGYEVHAVEDGKAALAALSEGSFELLLTDIVMPGIDGIELAHHAGTKAPDIRIMFITGFAAVASHAMNETGLDAKVLSKPFHLNRLVEEVGRLLAA